MTRDRPRTLTIASNDRARIPFSIIGVFLLITSVSVVGYMETRPDPEPEVDVSTAIDQAAATTQTVLREATADATRKASQEPVTVSADTPAGRALDAGSESVFRRYVKLRVYLEMQERLRTAKYTEAGTTTRMSLPTIDYSQSSVEEAIEKVSLTIGSDSGTPDVEDGTVKATVEDISYEVSRDGDVIEQQTNDVTVTVSTTTFLVHDKVEAYQDKLQTDFFDGSGFGRQFAGRLYPLMYGKAYYERMAPPTKSGAFKKMVMKKDIEVLANSANFAIQRGTFGTDDPAAENVMLAAWSCVAARNAEKIYKARTDGEDGDRDTDNTNNDNTQNSDNVGGSETGVSSESQAYSKFGFGAKDFCRATKFLTGGASGQSPESIQEVLNQVLGDQAQGQLQQENEVEIDRFADPAIQEVRGEEIDFDAEYREEAESEDPLVSDEADEPDTGGDLPDDFSDTDYLADAVDRIFSYTATASADSASHVDGTFPEADPGGDWEEIEGTGDLSFVENEEFDVQHEETWDDETGKTRQLHTYTITVRNRLEHSKRFRREVECEDEDEEGPCYEPKTFDDRSTVEFEKTVTIGGTYSDDDAIKVDPLEIEEPYSGSGPNFEAALEESVEEGLGVSGSSAGTVESDLEEEISFSSIESASGLDGQIDGEITEETELDSDVFLSSGERSALESTLQSEAESIHRHVIGEASGSPDDVDPIEVSSMEMATGDDVFAGLSDQITTGRYVYFDTGSTYASAREKAVVEARMEYYEAVHGWIDRVEEARSSSTSDVNGQISDGVDGSSDVLNDGLEFASDTMDGSVPDLSGDGTFGDDPGLTGPISYSVDASPTYLSVTPVMRDTSPGIRPEQADPADVAGTTHAPMAVRKHNKFGWPGVPVIPWPTYWYLSVDYWDVEVNGEYGRFEVTANNDDPASPKSMTYVRQAQPVELEIQGQQRTVGSVDPIDFSSKTGVVIPVPGGTVHPKPKFGVGDEWRLNPNSAPWQNMCSGTWPHAGPDFMPSDVNFGDCNNLQQGGEYTIDTFLPSGDGGNGILSQFEVESDGDIELADGEMPVGCTKESVLDALDGNAEDWFTDLGPYSGDDDEEPNDEQQRVVDQYCGLENTDQKNTYADLLKDEESDDAAETWRQMVLHDEFDPVEIKITVQYIVELPDEHDIERFRTADDVNDDADGAPPHKEPGIVTRFEVGPAKDFSGSDTPDAGDTFARIYGIDSDYGPKGSWLARRDAVSGRDVESIINRFALWDDSVVVGDSGWADYHCVGKAYVPEGVDMRLSEAGSFNAFESFLPDATNDLSAQALSTRFDGRLDGGIMQFEIIDYRNGPMNDNDEYWAPLGRINEVAVDEAELRDRWTDADIGDNLGDPDECGETTSNWDPDT